MNFETSKDRFAASKTLAHAHQFGDLGGQGVQVASLAEGLQVEAGSKVKKGRMQGDPRAAYRDRCGTSSKGVIKRA